MQKLSRRKFSNLMLASLALPQVPNNAQSPVKSEDEILEAEQGLISASLDGKWETADRLLAADYLQIDPDGSVYRKDKVVASIKEWSAFPENIRPRPGVTQSDLITRILGETAIVIGRVTSKQGYASYDDYVKKRPAKQFIHESRFTHVWIRSENRWQLFSSHRTNIGVPDRK